MKNVNYTLIKKIKFFLIISSLLSLSIINANSKTEEITWVTRELGSHPSLIIWCGNNEKKAKYRRRFKNQVGKNFADYALFHHDIPRITHSENPAKAYRPASPYSSLYDSPWAWHTGDSHPWKRTLGSAGPDFWAYRERKDRFASEGGVMGAAVLETMNQFLPENQRYLRSLSWNYHDNTYNLDDNMYSYNSLEFWTGKDPKEIKYEDYINLSSLLQAEGYSEYINNFRRRKFTVPVLYSGCITILGRQRILGLSSIITCENVLHSSQINGHLLL